MDDYTLDHFFQPSRHKERLYRVGLFCLECRRLKSEDRDMYKIMSGIDNGSTRMQFSKPVIAVVSDYAVAGGLELSLLADLRKMEKSAIMGVFCSRFGVPLIDGGTVRLPKLIGLSRALDLILTGHEAYDFGLPNRVVPDGQIFQCALELAERISAFPQHCMRADRTSADYSMYDALCFTEAMQCEFDNAKDVILKESISGAKKFTSGTGRQGKFT
ncbi:probable enoyl-CoA hydratase, mitochondrial [Narcine bancroftii]|uniref:probable enoyl-CoA hydratase, mitochondrial n=1 Tax=Narcine bancroftii TaxID=1343680 RepID=UPI003831790C